MKLKYLNDKLFKQSEDYFSSKRGGWQKANVAFRCEYLPSAVRRYLESGQRGLMDNLFRSVNNMYGLSKFATLLKRLNCHPFDATSRTSYGRMDKKGQKKRDNLLKAIVIKPDSVLGKAGFTGSMQAFEVKILEFLVKEELSEEKTAKEWEPFAAFKSAVRKAMSLGYSPEKIEAEFKRAEMEIISGRIIA